MGRPLKLRAVRPIGTGVTEAAAKTIDGSRMKRAGARLCAQHGRDQEVQVLWGAWSQEPRANHKAQAARPRLKEVRSRSCGLTNRNRVAGAASQGERASTREALATKGGRRKPGNRAAKATTLTWGDLALRLKGRRREAEREVSRGRSSGARSRAGQPPTLGSL